MSESTKQQPRTPLVEQIVNMSKWDKTATWEALAARTMKNEHQEIVIPGEKEPKPETKSKNNTFSC